MLEIEIKVADLRRLITLSDKNSDGKIDFNEFHDMLYGKMDYDENVGLVYSDDD